MVTVLKKVTTHVLKMLLNIHLYKIPALMQRTCSCSLAFNISFSIQFGKFVVVNSTL